MPNRTEQTGQSAEQRHNALRCVALFALIWYHPERFALKTTHNDSQVQTRNLIRTRSGAIDSGVCSIAATIVANWTRSGVPVEHRREVRLLEVWAILHVGHAVGLNDPNGSV